MKRILCLLTMCTAIAVGTAFSQCNQYYQFEEGNEWEMETYNQKDKLTGKIQQKVTSFQKAGNGFTAKINSVTYNEKGKELTKGDLDFKCNDGIMYIDMRNFVTDEQMAAFKGYNLTVEGDNLEVPSTLSVGQSLKDASIHVNATDAPIPMKMQVSITDRKVVGQETITTPAGTFECYKLTSKMYIKTIVGLNFSTIEWIAPKVGMVRSESYNKGGKLMGYNILTKRK